MVDRCTKSCALECLIPFRRKRRWTQGNGCRTLASRAGGPRDGRRPQHSTTRAAERDEPIKHEYAGQSNHAGLGSVNELQGQLVKACVSDRIGPADARPV
jgi:hypothetical protein